MSDTSVRSDLLTAPRERVVIVDGAMGTMWKAHDLALEEFQGHEGCNEILDITRPVVVRLVPDAASAVGGDVAETSTFGSNWTSLAGDDIVDRIRETALAGGWIARQSADAWSALGDRFGRTVRRAGPRQGLRRRGEGHPRRPRRTAAHG